MNDVVEFYKENEIHENNISWKTKGESYYTVSDKGLIYGTTVEIIKRKIDRLNAKPKYTKKGDK
jgi:hypothetical protein